MLVVNPEVHWKKNYPNLRRETRTGGEIILHAGDKREWQSEEGWGVHLGKEALSHLLPGAPGNPFVGNKQVDFLIDTGAICSVLNTS